IFIRVVLGWIKALLPPKVGLCQNGYYNSFVVFILLGRGTQMMDNLKNGKAQLKQLAIAVLLCISFARESAGQRPDLTFDHYNVEDGLSQSTVWNIFEDSKGFIWFCTPDGLNKFDGY